MQYMMRPIPNDGSMTDGVKLRPLHLLRLHAHADHPGEDLFLARGGGERRRAVRVDFRRERERVLLRSTP